MDDYYKLLGVEPDAPVDEIKTAYRERKESGAGNPAQLNKAWNVLSDPYQRGRYDEQRAQAEEAGELDLTADEPQVVPARNGARQTRAEAAREARRAKQMQPPTIQPPAGTTYPQQKQRLIAMVIDLLVLVALLLVGAQFAAQAIAKSQKPATVDAITAKQDQIDALNKQLDAAKTAVNNDKKANNSAQQATDQKTVDSLNQQVKDRTKERDDLSAKLTPYYMLALALAYLVSLLYLLIPSFAGGRTLGKRFQHLRLVREDGGKAGLKELLIHYALPLAIAYLFLATPLGMIGAIVALFGVTMWMRNPNQQGMHDRLGHTIVVADAN